MLPAVSVANPGGGREGLGRGTVNEEHCGRPEEGRPKRGDEGWNLQSERDHSVEEADASADQQSDERC